MANGRWILAPLSWLYGLALEVRHWLYDVRLLSSTEVPVATICVGNLAVGGTGKTPHVEYLVRLLSKQYKVAVLSRGYKRKTHGFVLADSESTAQTIGDEPMQIHRKYANVMVAVCENRVRGVNRLLELEPNLDVVILDDAFQHRRIRCGKYILLTEHEHLYKDDHLLPYGNLRDLPSRSMRADWVIVTKCPEGIRPIDKRVISTHLGLAAFQHLGYSQIVYEPLPEGRALVVSGIANTDKLMSHVREQSPRAELMAYGDHYMFTKDDIADIMGREKGFDYVLTTEKDMERLRLTELPELLGDKLKVLPITVHVNETFDREMTRYVRESKAKKLK